jgi:hypothetical protein
MPKSFRSHTQRYLQNPKFKGTVSRDFLLLVFCMHQFPPSPRVFHLDRFEFFRKFAEIFASQCAPQVSFSLALLIPAANLPPVSTILAANLPPVSTTPVANCHRCQRHRRQICHRWQLMAKISGCRHLKVNLKAKNFIYVNSTTQRCPNKIINIFLLEGFFHLPPVSLTPVANLELRISPRIIEKIRNGPNGIIRGLGETGSRKKPEAKNLVTLSL